MAEYEHLAGHFVYHSGLRLVTTYMWYKHAYTMLIECEKNIWKKFNVVTLMTSLEKHHFYGLMDFLGINSCVYFSSIKALEDNQRTFLKRHLPLRQTPVGANGCLPSSLTWCQR